MKAAQMGNMTVLRLADLKVYLKALQMVVQWALLLVVQLALAKAVQKDFEKADQKADLSAFPMAVQLAV